MAGDSQESRVCGEYGQGFHIRVRKVSPTSKARLVSFVPDDVQNTWDRVLPHETGIRTVTRNLYCSAITQRPQAAQRNRRLDRSIAPSTKRCT